MSGPSRRDADPEHHTPKAPPAFPSIPLGALLDGAEPGAEVDPMLAATTEELAVERPARSTEMRALAVGLGCVLVIASGVLVVVLTAAVVFWLGLFGA